MRLTAIAVGVALALTAPAVAQPKDVTIAPIAGVVGANAAWDTAWTGPMTADGMAVSADGLLLFAQEQSNAIWKLWPDGKAWVEVPYVHGAGAVAVDQQGQLYTVERACTDPGLKLAECTVKSRVMQLSPERKAIAEQFADGKTLGRLNDVELDGHGGAFFTQGALHHTTADGTVTTVYRPEAFTNGVALSADGKTLYVTDSRKVIALDVGANGATSNQRVFATLSKDSAGFGGDGMAVDTAGRLYVTGDAGVYVFDSAGNELGVIPVPRRAITLALAGPDRKTLYVGAMGAATPAGAEWTTPEGVRNVAMTIYRLPVLTSGAN